MLALTTPRPCSFNLYRASLQLSPFSCISKFFLDPGTFLSILKYIQVSFSPKTLPLFCYTYIIHSVKQKNITVNPFERVAYTQCFLFLTIHSCKPLAVWTLPPPSREITALLTTKFKAFSQLLSS